MFYDLNIPYKQNDAEQSRTLHFSYELGYNVVALNHTITGKLPAVLQCAIPDPLPLADLPPKLNVLRRVTLILTETLQNARLAELSKNYDLLALRPVDEKTLQLACGSYDCDIISLDLTQRYPFPFKFKTLSEAIKSGKRFELCYSQALLGDSQARKNLISNATQIIRASRGRGLIFSSEAGKAVGLRGPWDVVNLTAVWGLGQERGHEGVSKEARSVVVAARLKRTGFRGVIDVVYGGEKSTAEENVQGSEEQGQVKGTQTQVSKGTGTLGKAAAVSGQKRKADFIEDGQGKYDDGVDKPISNRERKRRAKKAKAEITREGNAVKLSQTCGTELNAENGS